MHLYPLTYSLPLGLPVFLLTLVVCSCASTHKAVKTDELTSTAPKLVGRIASIPPERKFVLIQSYGPWDTPMGTILTTRGEQDRTANLLFTGEKLGHFAAADIQSGTVERGDAVYSRHVPKPSDESLPTASDGPMPSGAATDTLPDPAQEPILPDTADHSQLPE